MKNKKNDDKVLTSSMDDIYINYNKNQPIDSKKMEALFQNIKHTKWYKITKLKIILINISFLINRQEKLLKQKLVFLTFFNQHYNLNYSLLIKNYEFDNAYNKAFTFGKFIKPY